MALTCVTALSACGDSDEPAPPADTVGSLNVSVNRDAALVVVTGPNSYSKEFTGSQFLADLVPGQYVATATATGFETTAGQINVVAGYTSTITLLMQATGSNPDVGSLNVNVNPASATVAMNGPDGYTQTFTGNQFLSGLKPGEYTASAGAPGYGDASTTVNVVGGYTSSISLILQPNPILTAAPRAVYRDAQGNLIPLSATSLQSGKFVFYAWLEDKPQGIVPSKLVSDVDSDPGKPLVEEQMESAPSFTQNVAAAWVGYTDSAGVVRPVIGADVRWEIDQWWEDRVNSTQFGTSDDNRVALGYGVYDDQADTRTNNSRLSNEGFPLIATEFPLFNVTGVGSPFVDGFTWVTLFSPDARAASRIVVVATINGEEIGKQILYKKFAPTPILKISKTVNRDVVNLVDGEATVTWTVIVENIGTGDATEVDVSDILSLGSATAYTLDDSPAGSTEVGDGFTLTFPLKAGGPARTMTFKATVTEPGTYCNEASVVSYADSDSDWTPIDLSAEACFTALESNVSIVKDFVADDLTTSLGKARTVAANAPVKLRVRVINSGGGTATGVKIHDELTSGDAAKYELVTVAPGTANSTDGFDTNVGDLASGATTTVILTVKASADGVYCDTATVTVTSGDIGIGSDRACVTVATPNLTITKVDAPGSVIPGATYTSTIVVTNTGSATANDVVISDVLGLNPDGNVRAIYVSSSLNGVGGTLSNSVITANRIDIPAGGSVTFLVVSRIPPGAASGEYCDTATVTSSNGGTKEAKDCVDVPAFSALQTQIVDIGDPVAVGGQLTFFSVLYVESLSNEGVSSNELTFSFGLASPEDLGEAGLFEVVSTKVYVDTAPIRDASTGLVISDSSNATARLQVQGSNYTLNGTTPGLQLIDMTPSVVLNPGTAIYVAHVVRVPPGTATNRLYTTSYIWDSVGTVNAAHTYQASSSEPTTVLP